MAWALSGRMSATTGMARAIRIVRMATSSVAVAASRRSGARWLRLIARRSGPREHGPDGGGPRPHVHRHVAALGTLVEVGVEIVRAVRPMQVDRKDLQDRGALGLDGRKEIRAREDVVEVVVEHVEVVEDRRRLGKALGKLWRRL